MHGIFSSLKYFSLDVSESPSIQFHWESAAKYLHYNSASATADNYVITKVQLIYNVIELSPNRV